jgi:hypothetical protein
MLRLYFKSRKVCLQLLLRHSACQLSTRRAYSAMTLETDANGKGRNPKFSNLAPDVIENIIRQVNNRRAVPEIGVQELDEQAKNGIFQDVFISPLDEHVSTWTCISESNALRQIPHHAIIHTQSDINQSNSRFIDGSEEITGAFRAALAALSRFPNLESLEIGFTPECLGDREPEYEEVLEDVPRRKELLTMIFRAIEERAADPDNKPIRKLTIINLQNCPIPDFTSTELFRGVMANLEELHVSLTQEYNEHGPDHDYTHIELRTFPAHFISSWLAPISSNLCALSIYSLSENWGPFPGFFDFNNVSFPKLETLALGYYTLAHDDSIDWILRIKSLRRLILHNAMIASWIRIDTSNMDTWKPNTKDWVSMRSDDDCPQWEYNGKWSTVLDRLAAELPNLSDLRFDSGSSYSYGEERYGLNDRETCGTRVFPKRYVYFDNGILPTHWPEAEDDGEMEPWFLEELEGEETRNLHEKYLEEDQRSLDALLEKIGARKRKANEQRDLGEGSNKRLRLD